jgi:outer membrane protein TolC
LVQDYFNQGILQKTDVLNVEVRVNDLANQLQYAKSNVQNASDYLAFLINEDPKEKSLNPTKALQTALTLEITTETLSDNRKDLQAMAKSTAAYQKMLQSAKMNFLPHLNAFGSYELYDRNLFGTAAKGYLVGAQLSWSLFDGYQSIGKAGQGQSRVLKIIARNPAIQSAKPTGMEQNQPTAQRCRKQSGLVTAFRPIAGSLQNPPKPIRAGT